MDRAQLRAMPWPELTLIALGLLFVVALMVGSSTHSCHQWKDRLVQLSGAFLGAAGAEEHPQPEHGVTQERRALQDAASRLLDDRPFACL